MLNEIPNIKEVIIKAIDRYRQLTQDQIKVYEESLPSFKNNDQGNLCLMLGFLNGYSEVMMIYPNLIHDPILKNIINEKLIFYLGNVSRQTQEDLIIDFSRTINRFFHEEHQEIDAFNDVEFIEIEEEDENKD